jgi:hypothetical protein
MPIYDLEEFKEHFEEVGEGFRVDDAATLFLFST